MPDIAGIIETDIPARLDRLPWTRFHTLVVAALGITWILDGLDRRGSPREPCAPFHSDRSRPRRQRLSDRCGHRCGAVRLSDRSVRPQEAVLCNPWTLPNRDCGDRLLLGFLELRAFPFPDRGRHRRRIHGDQLGDPGADPGALSWAHRPCDQR